MVGVTLLRLFVLDDRDDLLFPGHVPTIGKGAFVADFPGDVAVATSNVYDFTYPGFFNCVKGEVAVVFTLNVVLWLVRVVCSVSSRKAVALLRPSIDYSFFDQ